jgi:hypothetical protein
MILAAAAVISPWLVRNARVMGGPVLATSGGVTIWKLAYNDEEMAPPDGAAPEYMEVNRLARPRELALNGGDPARMTPIYNMEPRYQILMYPEEVRSRIGPEMGEVEADREFSRMAMEYVREHPLQVARHMVEGFLKTLMATEMDGRVNVVLVLMLPFLLLGAFRLQTRAPGASLVVLSCLASMLAVHMAFYFDHRFRVPYEAFMAIPAAAGMAAVWQGGLSLREKVMLFGWAALVAVANRPYIFGPQSG